MAELKFINGKPSLCGDSLREIVLANKANLSGADLSGADLSRANLFEADLSGADLSRANLYGADLSGANLSGANLYGADLSGANLSGADLSRADLSGANLSGADLSGADLSRANLFGANLSGANLYGANLYGANLPIDTNSKLILSKTLITPEGDIIGYKKCKYNVIVKLLIPAEAKRCNATGRKCRAEFAKVLEVYGTDIAQSKYDETFIYKPGETVKPREPFDENRFNECSSGIHFFLTREEAEAY